MREFESNTGETLRLHLDGMEGDVADELLLWENPAVNVSGSSVMVSREAYLQAFDKIELLGVISDHCREVVCREFDPQSRQ